MTKKVLIVGRHDVDLGSEAQNYEVLATEPITFSKDSNVVIEQIRELAQKARTIGAEAILFQNVPGILAAALIKLFNTSFLNPELLRFGIIIPGERKTTVRQSFYFASEPDTEWGATLGQGAANEAAEAVKFANGSARVEVLDNVTNWKVDVTVEPISSFVFSHIEWL